MAEDQVADAPAEEPAGQAPSVAESQEFDFRQHLSDDLKDHASLATYKDINSMAKSLVNAQKMVGADKVAIPGNWANEDDWSQVYSKLGRPDEASGYTLDGGEGAVDENVERFKKMAFDAGLNTNQAQKLLNSYNAWAAEGQNAPEEDLQQKQVAVETSLKKDWGDKYDRRMAQANEVLEQFGSKELAELDLGGGSRLGDNETLIKLFADIGHFMHEKIGEDNFSGRESEPGLSDNDVNQNIAKLTAPNMPYWDKNHPSHEFDVQEVLRLRGLLNGE
jgi:hypothetical protein|tara:strand:+ start:979 stop:1809 length:831 start_codon:yes stop_codon:yes gene_type:complete